MAASPEQLHELLKYCLDFGKTMLEDSGEFYPFGAVIAADGKLRAGGAYDGNEKPKSQDIYRLLSDAPTSDPRAGNLLAIALAANVNIPSTTNPRPLMGCGFSWRPTATPGSYTCYRREGFFKKTTTANFGEPISVDVPPQIFLSANG